MGKIPFDVPLAREFDCYRSGLVKGMRRTGAKVALTTMDVLVLDALQELSGIKRILGQREQEGTARC